MLGRLDGMRTTAPAIAPDACTSTRILDRDMVPTAPATAQHDDALDITGHAFEVRISSPAPSPTLPLPDFESLYAVLPPSITY